MLSDLTLAVVFTDVGQVAVREVSAAEPGPGEVQVRTDYSAISPGTEGWILQNRFTWAPTTYPCVPGYQRTGIVTAVGAGVSGWSIGDRVFATRGRWDGSPVPMAGAHRGLANTPEDEVYRLPAAIDEVEAAAAVAAQVGVNAASRLALSSDDWVLVLGDGLIGQLGAQAARARGARVALVGHRAERLSLAAAHSADRVVDERDTNWSDQVRALIGSNFVSAVIDTVQTEKAQLGYIDLLERGSGQIVYSGFTPSQVWADMAILQQRELSTHFVSGWTRERLETTLGLLAAGTLRVSPLITHRAPPADAPRLYEMILTKSEPSLGVVFDWRSR